MDQHQPHVFVTGGTGFVGASLIPTLVQKGFHVIAPSRKVKANTPEITYIPFDDSWTEWLAKSKFVVNLAGHPVIPGLITRKGREQVYRSRVHTTRKLVDILNTLSEKPPLISASAIGIYPSSDQEQSESSPQGKGILTRVCQDWEKEALSYTGRVHILRIAMVLSPSGGALAKMMPPVKFGLGAILGDGSQHISWIRIEDLCSMIVFFMQHQNQEPRIINAVSPDHVSNETFMRAIADFYNRPLWIHVPKSLLSLTLKEAADIVLMDHRIRPDAALKAGFNFQYPKFSKDLLV